MKKAMLIVGILGAALGALISVFFLILPAFSHTSGNEAMPGILGGCCCSLVFLVMAIVGLVLVLKARKAAEAGQGGQPPKV
jgi:hypothetical protein